MQDREHLVATAHALADAARACTLPLFRSAALHPENKATSGFDPVTRGDRDAEAAMRAVLAEQRPQDAIFGEEFGTSPGTSGLTWVLDPIDGTRAFISGIPSWGTLIGIEDGSGPVYGIIDQPFTDERFVGGFGDARVSGRHGAARLRTRSGVALPDATLMTTFPEMGEAAAGFRRVADRVRLTRYGLDCYAYALLAAGHIDLVIEAGLQPYDIVAPIAVIAAAGGVVTDWEGGSARHGGRVLAAATPALHAAALALLADPAA